MTISRAPSRSESSTIGRRSDQASRPGRTAAASRSKSLDSVVRRWERDPERSAELAQARKHLGRSLYADKGGTLTSLRLASGLSQAQLAARMQTSQSYIARIERGQNDPTTDVVERIAVALGVESSVAFAAVRRQRELFR